MKKHIYTVTAFAVFAASALAANLTELDVKVPFAFKVGGSTLPAGKYRVTEANSGFFLVRGEKGGVFVPRGEVVLDVDDAGKTSLRFKHTGEDTYVLQAVHSER
jgi:hypothetical protein